MRVERRRSPRVAVRISLDAEWVSGDRTIQQRVMTESISAHGALLRVLTSDPPSTTIQLASLTTGQRQAARIVDANEVTGIPGLFQLRVEFEVPALEFWGHEELSRKAARQARPQTD